MFSPFSIHKEANASIHAQTDMYVHKHKTVIVK